MYTNNCIGLGNRLVFIWFTFSAAIGCLLNFVVGIYVERYHYCPHSKGLVSPGSLNPIVFHVYPSQLNGYLEAQLCMFFLQSSLATIKWMSFLCVIWIGGIGLNQLYMIYFETTTYEVIKGRRRHLRQSSYLSGWINILRFLINGSYKVSTREFDARTFGRKDYFSWKLPRIVTRLSGYHRKLEKCEDDSSSLV